MDIFKPYPNFILCLIVTLSLVLIYYRDQIQDKIKKKYFAITCLFVAVISIWFNYYHQNVSSKKSYEKLEAIKEQNENLRMELKQIQTQNTNLDTQLIGSLKTINSLDRQLTKSIEMIKKTDKERKIELLRSLSNEIKNNMELFKKIVLPLKEELMKENYVVHMFNFSCFSIEKNIAEATINDPTLSQNLNGLHKLFIISNNFFNVCMQKPSLTPQAKAENMRTMFGNFSQEKLQSIDYFIDRLGNYIDKL